MLPAIHVLSLAAALAFAPADASATGNPATGMSGNPSSGTATQVNEAALLVEQGKRLQAEGKAAVAKELYRAALLLDPSDAEAHRLLAGLLYEEGACAEAAAEYRAFVQLAPLRSRRGPSWDEALLRIATCVRSDHATVVLLTSLDARCAVDKGVYQHVLAARPLSIDLAPGEHVLECVRDGHPRETRAVSLAPKETVRVEVAFAVSAATASTAASTTANTTVLDAALSLASNEPVPATVQGAVHSSADELLLLPLPELPVDDLEPAASASSVVDEIPTATLRIETAGTGWSCTAAGQEVAFDDATVARLEVSPGAVVVACSHPDAEPVDQQLEFAEGELRSIEVPFVPKAVQVTEVVAKSESEPDGASKALPGEAPPTPVDGASAGRLGDPGLEFSMSVGMGPALGSYGLGLGARYRHVGLALGTGWQPFSVALNYFGAPGGTGFYASAGYQNVGPAPLFGAARVSGFELFGSAGLDARPLRHVGVRLGVGLAYNSVEASLTGPMRLDFAVSFIP